MKRIYILAAVLVAALVIILPAYTSSRKRAVRTSSGAKTVTQRLEQYGDIARARLHPYFEQAGVIYPPNRLALVGLKEEQTVQVYALRGGGAWRFVRDYRIQGASSEAGPKLRAGDYQVPEGIYRIESLNPYSAYHLGLRVGYPNDFDREQAARDGRSNLGGNIMIHGNIGSEGCLAIGDEALEDLFVLAADTGLANVSVILSPVDFRAGKSVGKMDKLPPWTATLYDQIKARLAELPPEK